MLRKTGGLGTGLFIFAVTTVNAGYYAGAGIGPDTADFIQRSRILQQSPNRAVPSFDVINKSHLSATGFSELCLLALKSFIINIILLPK